MEGLSWYRSCHQITEEMAYGNTEVALDFVPLLLAKLLPAELQEAVWVQNKEL